MAITVLTDATTAVDSRTLSWTIPTLASGDVVVVAAVTWDSSVTLNVPSGTGLSFTERVNQTAGSKTNVYIWTAVASAGGSGVVVTCSVAGGGGSVHTGALYQLPTADGYSLDASPNVASGITGGTGSVSLAGTSGNVGIVALGDWNGVSGSPTWLASATQAYATVASGDSGQYSAYCTLTGSSTTVGLSAPSAGTSFTVGAIEVLAGGGSPPPSEGTASGTHAWVGSATGTNRPAVPGNLQATAISDTEIDLSWDAAFGAGGYDIERDGVIIVTDHPLTTYSDTGLTAETEYDYRVRSVE